MKSRQHTCFDEKKWFCIEVARISRHRRSGCRFERTPYPVYTAQPMNPKLCHQMLLHHLAALLKGPKPYHTAFCFPQNFLPAFLRRMQGQLFSFLRFRNVLKSLHNYVFVAHVEIPHQVYSVQILLKPILNKQCYHMSPIRTCQA